MLTEDEVLRQRYDAREKAHRDAIWVERDHRRRLEEAHAQIEEARVQTEEARESGLRRGELIGRIHVCQRLLKQSPSPMPELEGMALDDLEALANRLESDLSG